MKCKRVTDAISVLEYKLLFFPWNFMNLPIVSAARMCLMR